MGTINLILALVGPSLAFAQWTLFNQNPLSGDPQGAVGHWAQGPDSFREETGCSQRLQDACHCPNVLFQNLILVTRDASGRGWAVNRQE